jgi:chemotaxis protein MotB
MSNKSRIAVTALLAIAAAGCGPSKKEQQLTSDLTLLQTKSATLETQVNDLTKQNATLKTSLDEAQAQVATMSTEKEQLKTESAETAKQYDQLLSQLSSEVESGNLQIREYQNMLSVDVAEKLFFDSGSATLKKSGKDVLAKVGEALKQYPDKVIRVVGHTDNVPLGKSAAFASNWELSAMRATHVVRFLQDKCQIEPERLVASGRGPYDPVADNSTAEGRQKNRRIEIMLLDKNMVDSMSQREGSKK